MILLFCIFEYRLSFVILFYTKFQIYQPFNIKITMDYEALSIFLSKPVPTWNIIDIKKWLHFIHMQKLFPLFENNRFNGDILTKTNNKQLTNIGITSNIMQKKLMAWIEKGFGEFDQYLTQTNYDKENICPNLNLRKTQSTKGVKKVHNNLIQMVPQEPASVRLMIKHFEGTQNAYYIAERKGLRIGRALTNEIQSLEVTVENQHAQIIQDEQQFKMIDLGTKSGTFIKVHYKIQLTQNMLIQIGWYLFKVTSFNIFTKTITFACLNLLTNQAEQIVIGLSIKPTYSMGRRANNDFARDDQHMSGTHAKIYFFNEKFILEDMGSTNGTWLRLSEYMQPSQPITLVDGAIFKVGSTITYICTYEKPKNDNNKMEIEENSHICLQCSQNERDVLFLPCKHTISCMDCSKNITECPLCHHQIQEKLKIFI